MRTRIHAARALLPLAVALPVCALAQTNVQVYGILDVYAGRSASSGVPASTVVGSGGLSTSFWGVRGSEQLAGSTRAVFSLESFIRLDTGETGRAANDPMFSRNAYVGLADTWGELRLGRQSQPLWLTAIAFNPLGASTRFSPLQVQLWTLPYGGNNTGDTGWSNAIGYTSPDLHGLIIRAMTGLGETDAATRNTACSGVYTRGPFALGLAGQRVKVGPGIGAAQPAQSNWFTGLSYEFKPAKLYASFSRNHADGTDRLSRTWHAGASVHAGPGQVLLDWAHTHDQSGGKLPFHRNTGALGYDYPLSSRTGLYAIGLYDKLSTASSGTSLAVGVRERF